MMRKKTANTAFAIVATAALLILHSASLSAQSTSRAFFSFDPSDPDDRIGNESTQFEDHMVNNETGWSGATIDGADRFRFTLPQTGSLSYTDGNGVSVDTSANRLRWDDLNASSSANQGFFFLNPSDAAYGSDFWFSSLVHFNGTDDEIEIRFRGDTTASNVLQTIFAPGTNMTVAGQTISGTSGMTTGQTHLIVGQYSKNGASDDTIQWWVDPDIGGSTPTNELFTSGAVAATGNDVISDVGQIEFYAPFGNDNALDTELDEVVYGDSFTSAVVPEPSAYTGAAGLLALAFALARRSKR